MINGNTVMVYKEKDFMRDLLLYLKKKLDRLTSIHQF